MSAEGAALGLTSEDARSRLRKDGAARQPMAFRPNGSGFALGLLLDPSLIAALAILAAVAAFGQPNQAMLLGGALGLLVLAALVKSRIGSVAARSAARSFRRKALVIRDGIEQEVPARSVVPGDLVVLRTGARAPVPLTVVSGFGLRFSGDLGEGGSVPAGSWVLAGHGVGRAEPRAAGKSAAWASVPEDLSGEADEFETAMSETSAPILARVRHFAFWMMMVALALAGALALVLLSKGQLSVSRTAVLVAGLMVFMVPPGLVLGAQTLLSVRMRRLADVGAAARNTRAFEALSTAGFVVLDSAESLRTPGTELRAVGLPGGWLYRIDAASGAEAGVVVTGSPERMPALRDLVRVAVVAGAPRLEPSDPGYRPEGDPDGVAAGAAAMELGLEAEDFQAVAADVDLPPSIAAAALVEGGQPRLCLRGPVEAVLDICSAVWTGQSVLSLDREAMRAEIAALDAQGLRHVGVAVSEGPVAGDAAPADLMFLGVMAYADHLAASAPKASERAREARVRLMVLDDRPSAPARADGVRLGLVEPFERVARGDDIDNAVRLGQGALDNLVRPSRVFAEIDRGRDHKRRVADSLMRDGYVVLALGSRHEDMPALRASELGAALNRAGADSVVETAPLILRDGKLETVLDAVGVARSGFERLRRMLACTVATGGGVVLLYLLAVAGGATFPLLPGAVLAMAVLFALATDLVFAVEPDEPAAILRRRRRSAERLPHGPLLLSILVSAVAMGVILFAVIVLSERMALSADTVRGTLALAIGGVGAVRLLSARRDDCGILSLGAFANPLAWIAALGLVGATAAMVMVPPLAERLHFEVPPHRAVALAAAAAFAMLVVEEILRRLRVSIAARRMRASRRARG